MSWRTDPEFWMLIEEFGEITTEYGTSPIEMLRDAVEVLHRVHMGTTKITVKASADSSTHPEENSVSNM